MGIKLSLLINIMNSCASKKDIPDPGKMDFFFEKVDEKGIFSLFL
jgi:hypothetical protein